MSGLHFYKLDLHVHTPASNCYLHKNQTAAQIVQAALDMGLHGIAITDHNNAAWIDEMKKAAADTGLVIFPGVEISLEHGHLVAIFDPGATQRDVEGLLGNLDLKPAEFGKSETVCTKSVYDVVDTIHSRGGLAVLAHIDQLKGIFNDYIKIKENGGINVPAPLLKIINEAQYDAVECANGKLPDGFDETHHIKRKPAFYQASDNPDLIDPKKHSAAGIGSRHSWFKLDSMDIEGLRQCFADPEVRIQLMNQHSLSGYSKIISMRVGGSGFLKNQIFEFHEGLNCLIGGKGVGKSLAIELLRFGLNQPPREENLLFDHVGKLDKQFMPDNWVELIYQTADGAQYKIRRTFTGRRGGQKSADFGSELTCENITTNEKFQGDVPRMFPILAYSQTEVIKITEDKNAQLELIDQFIDTHEMELEINAIQAKLHENDTVLCEAIQARDRLESCQREINTIVEKITSLNKLLADPIFDMMKAAETKQLSFQDRIKFIDELISRVRTFQRDLKSVESPDLPKDLSGDADLCAAQSSIDKGLPIIRQSLENVIPQLNALTEEIDETYKRWLPEFNQISSEYSELLRTLGGDRVVKNAERMKLDAQLAEYRKEEQRYLSSSKKLTELLEVRDQLLDKLERAHRGRYEIRKEKYDELTALSDNKLRLLLDFSVERSLYEKELTELIRGGTNALPSSDRYKIVENIHPRRLIQLVLKNDHVRLADESGLTELWAIRVIQKLWAGNDFARVLALQHDYFPGDMPSILFHRESGDYGELGELSVGQKCTALLIIALCDGKMPVIIDQPEDALDVISVWEDIAKKLRRGKTTRQFILTTHNSSVAVAADADQFIVLKADARVGMVVAAGAIDRPDVRQAVIDHLEGGDEPYKLRSRKYNIH